MSLKRGKPCRYWGFPRFLQNEVANSGYTKNLQAYKPSHPSQTDIAVRQTIKAIVDLLVFITSQAIVT